MRNRSLRLIRGQELFFKAAIIIRYMFFFCESIMTLLPTQYADPLYIRHRPNDCNTKPAVKECARPPT